MFEHSFWHSKFQFSRNFQRAILVTLLCINITFQNSTWALTHNVCYSFIKFPTCSEKWGDVYFVALFLNNCTESLWSWAATVVISVSFFQKNTFHPIKFYLYFLRLLFQTVYTIFSFSLVALCSRIHFNSLRLFPLSKWVLNWFIFNKINRSIRTQSLQEISSLRPAVPFKYIYQYPCGDEVSLLIFISSSWNFAPVYSKTPVQ